MRRAAFALVLLIATPAAADPPVVLALAENDTPGASPERLERLADGKDPQVLLDKLPTGSYGLAIDGGSGRWAMTFGQLSNGDPLELDGKAVSKPDDRNTIVFGDASGVVSSTYGDPSCTSKKTSCFELPLRFTADGKYVFVMAAAMKGATVSRWTFGAKPKRATVSDTKLGQLFLAPDLTRAAYFGKDGIHVIAWPAQKTKAAKVKGSKTAVANPSMMMAEEAWPIGDRVYWFRREPKEQKEGFYEAYDVKTKQTIALHQSTQDYAMPRGAFLSTGPRGTVVFGDDVGFERADVYEAKTDGDAPATAIAHDVRQILDVSPDGKYLLVTRRLDPAKGNDSKNPERLVIIDLATGQDAAVLDPGGDGITINAAGFVP